MDINTISNFAVAIGTLALAYSAFKNIRNSDKQLKFLKKQTDLFLSQQQPDIQIKECSFNGNKLNLILYNSGNGVAYDIAVSSTFHIVKPIWWSKRWWSKGHLQSPVISEMRTKKFILNIDGFGESIFNFKTDDKNILNPASLVVFPIDEDSSNSLPAGFDRIFQCEPLFYLKLKEGLFGDTPDYIAKVIPFDELRTLLLKNNIKEISIMFSLLSKDKLQNVKIHGTISNFVIMLSNDETLEIAHKRGKRGPYGLDKDEIKSKLKWEDYDLYVHGKYLELNDDE